MFQKSIKILEFLDTLWVLKNRQRYPNKFLDTLQGTKKHCYRVRERAPQKEKEEKEKRQER